MPPARTFPSRHHKDAQLQIVKGFQGHARIQVLGPSCLPFQLWLQLGAREGRTRILPAEARQLHLGLVYQAELLFPAQKPGSLPCALWSSLPPLNNWKVATG